MLLAFFLVYEISTCSRFTYFGFDLIWRIALRGSYERGRRHEMHNIFLLSMTTLSLTNSTIALLLLKKSHSQWTNTNNKHSICTCTLFSYKMRSGRTEETGHCTTPDWAFDLLGYYTKISLVVLLLDVLNLCVLQEIVLLFRNTSFVLYHLLTTSWFVQY